MKQLRQKFSAVLLILLKLGDWIRIEIRAQISNSIYIKSWIWLLIYAMSSTAVTQGTWCVSNYVPLEATDMIAYQWPDFSWSLLVKIKSRNSNECSDPSSQEADFCVISLFQ